MAKETTNENKKIKKFGSIGNRFGLYGNESRIRRAFRQKRNDFAYS